ncbi:hypothetical protein [Jiangella asiatica]|uniref:DUF4439 domain-containing protein n=1 Tax=Jiangella asiatica TaxID=2530372 RepID=A0A4R5DPI8_9ACTN|nr:hypothetical protein [Jiangella asiatica]TDE14080.1 hypothetical protein E1269_04875 [Jiangella asiatica]
MIETVDARRRRLLVTLLGAPVAATLAGAALTGCSADPRPKAAPGARAELDADVKVRWSAADGEQALLALHAATVAAHPGLAERLAPLTAHHDEHLAALRDDGPLPFGARDDTAPAAPEVPADPAAALAAVVEAERAAGDARLTDCLAAAGPRLAAVLAAIAAAEAGHGVVLAS